MPKDSKSALTPKLRFSEFRDASPWRPSVLGKEASILKGKGISKSDIDPGGTQPCIRYGELYTVYGEIITSVVSRTKLPAEELFLSEANDVIIPSSGETKIDIATASCVLLDHVALGGDLNVIRTRLNGPFLSYYLNGPKRFDIARIAQGDTVVHLYPYQLEKLEIAVPSPTEQQKIADCLSTLDELIEAESRKLDALKAHKKGLMQQLFPRDGETRPRLRFPEFQDAPEWESKTVDDLVDTITPPKKLLTSDYRPAGQFPVIDQSQDYIGGWTDDEEAVIDDDLPVVVFGDHTCALKFVDRPFAQGADGIKILKAKADVRDDFLFYSLQANPVQQESYKRHFSTLRERVVAFPDKDSGEQRRIAACVSSLDDLIAAQSERLEALRAHKRGLMQQLFPSPDAIDP